MVAQPVSFTDGPLGIYKVQLDPRCRLKLPARLRDHLVQSFPNQNLFVTSVDRRTGRIYPIPTWQASLKVLDTLNETQRARKFIFTAYDLGLDGTMDAQGRILVHQKLREVLGVDPAGDNDDLKHVWLLWRKGGIDIYPKAVYDKLSEDSRQDPAENAEYLFDKGVL